MIVLRYMRAHIYIFLFSLCGVGEASTQRIVFSADIVASACHVVVGEGNQPGGGCGQQR